MIPTSSPPRNANTLNSLPYGVRIDNLLSISRSFVGGGSVPRSESPDGAGSYRTAPQGPLFRAQSRKSVDSTPVTSLRRARILWNSLRHLGRLTDVARAAVSDRACDPRLNDDHGMNTEISPDFRMCSGPGQDEVLHP